MTTVSVRVLTLSLLILTSFSAWADTGLPYVGWITETSPDPISLTIFPDGSGRPLSEASTFGPVTVDGTIVVGLVVAGGFPIPDFPNEDIWLETNTDACSACVSGYHSMFLFDEMTDVDGITFLSSAPTGGGHTEEPIYVYLNGMRAMTPEGILHGAVQLKLNSPDINNDSQVNLIDVTLFSTAFFGDYEYFADYHYDGLLNLADVAIFASGVGSSCP